MADYKFVLLQAGVARGELRALDAALTLRLDEPSDLVLRVNGLSTEAALLQPLESDILVYRDGVKVMRCVVGAVQDTLDAQGHYVDVNAVDYRGRLDRRILLADSNHNNEPDVDIAWDLIQDAQSATGGGMGISLGAVPTGVNRKLTFLAGETVRGAIDRIANVDNGFEWDIDPELQFVAWRAARGENRGRVLDYGGLAAAVRVNTDPTLFANAVRVVGDSTTAASVQTDIVAGVGRWDTETNLPTIDDQDLVDATAARVLTDGATDWVAYEVLLRDALGVQQWNGLGDIGLGDTVRLVVRSGRLDVNEDLRVRTLNVRLDGNGGEFVTLQLGGRRRRVDDRSRDVERRVNDLELLTE